MEKEIFEKLLSELMGVLDKVVDSNFTTKQQEELYKIFKSISSFLYLKSHENEINEILEEYEI